MIRVLYDEHCFAQTHGGVSRYFTELVKNLPKEFEGRFSAVCTNNRYLQDSPFNLPPMRQCVHDFICTTLRGRSFPGVSHFYRLCARLFPRKFPSGELANRRAFALQVKKGDFDILHITDPHPHFNWWKPVLGKKPIVATIHDLIPDILDGNRRVIKFRKQLIKDASHIIAVSNNTKNDLIRLYKVPADKITVVYHGYLADKESIMTPCSTATSQFLLYVGKRQGYKNFAFFLRALVPLLNKIPDLSVFCTGASFTAEEQLFIDSFGISNRVVQKFVSDGEMRWLFSHALAFVCPSKYEGFGIPILDAFANRCPVVVARASCFPEIAEKAALYFDPQDEKSLRGQLERILQDASLREELRKRGEIRAGAFSWNKCASETADVYRKLVAD